MKIGYVRVSSSSQNTERQEIIMEKLGVEKVFIDVCSGANTNRPQLKEMLQFIREGDILVVESISRLGRSTRDLLNIMDELEAKKVLFESCKEKIDTSTPSGRLVMTIFSAISQMEREYIKERQREGIEIRKARGEYKGRLPIQVDTELFKKEYDKWKSGEITALTAMKHLDLKPNTFYRRVAEYEKSIND